MDEQGPAFVASLERIVQRSAESEERKAAIQLEGYKAALAADDRIDQRLHERKLTKIRATTLGGVIIAGIPCS